MMIPWVIRLANELTPSSQISRIQTFPPSSIFVQCVSVHSSFHVYHNSCCSWLVMQCVEAIWAADYHLLSVGFQLTFEVLCTVVAARPWAKWLPSGGSEEPLPLQHNHRRLNRFPARFVIAFQNESAKIQIFDETNKKSKMKYAVGHFRSQLVTTIQNWKQRLHCLVSWNSNRKQRWESSFVSPLHQAIQFDVVHRFHDLLHKQCANFCRQHVHNLHVGVQACPGNFCFQGLFLLISTSLRDTSIG